MKILILGHARSGKDTLGELLKKHYNISYLSSSEAACDKFIYDDMRDTHGYKSKEECFNDRINHRDYWYESICEYNREDRARLAKEILNEAECYVGMRDYEEFKECVNQNLFDKIIWVDASKRLPNEVGSFNITMEEADEVIENNGTYEEFEQNVINFGTIFKN
jgi:dephospho-CoA kinase